MKLKVKLTTMVISSIIVIIGVIALFKNNKNMEDSEANVLKNAEGVLIMSGINGDIHSDTFQRIPVQIPIYDFSNELSSAKISVKNFNIGTVENINLVFHQSINDFDSYILNFHLLPQKEGNFDIDNMEVEIKTEKNIYREKLGSWDFNILNGASKDFDVIERSFFHVIVGKNKTYNYSSKLVNENKHDLDIKEVLLNNMDLLKNNQINETVKTQHKIEISKDLSVGSNILIKPKLTYIDENNEEKFFYLNETLYFSNYNNEKIKKLLESKNMV